MKKTVVILLTLLFVAVAAWAAEPAVYTRIGVRPVDANFQPDPKAHNEFVPDEEAPAWVEEAGGHWKLVTVLPNMAIAIPKGPANLTSREAGNKLVTCGNRIAYVRVPSGKFIELNPPSAPATAAPTVCLSPGPRLRQPVSNQGYVTLNGDVDPQGEPTTYWFTYRDRKTGVAANTETRTVTSVQAVSATVPFSVLQPNTTYQVTLHARNRCGTVDSATGVDFTTLPLLTTPAASGPRWSCGTMCKVIVGAVIVGAIYALAHKGGGCNKCGDPVVRPHGGVQIMLATGVARAPGSGRLTPVLGVGARW